MITPVYAKTCPKCEHRGHPSNGCLNASSDNDCDCLFDCRLSDRSLRVEEIPVDPEELASKGTRADKGKPELHMIPTEPLIDLARLFMFGAKKYSPNNWKRGMDYSRMYNSALRHMFKFWGGENVDPETGIHHLTAATWNMICLRFFEEYPILYAEFDNREINRAHFDSLKTAAESPKWIKAFEYEDKGLPMSGVIKGWSWPTKDRLMIEGLISACVGKYIAAVINPIFRGPDEDYRTPALCKIFINKSVDKTTIMLDADGFGYRGRAFDIQEIEEILEVRDTAFDIQTKITR